MFSKIKPNKIWNTSVFITNDNIWDESIESAKNVFLGHCRKIRTRKHNLHTIADPFLFQHDDKLYLFVEEKRSYEKGVIAYYSTSDLKKWEYGGVVLTEKFHLSYPFIFEENGTIFMLPESSEDNSLYLYEATDFPTTWKRKVKLLEGPFCDSSIIKHNDYYWLFTSKGYDELYIFYSKSLTHNWTPIFSEPIMKDVRYGRNGGGVVRINNELYRIAQDNTNQYGGNVNIMKIVSLETSKYEEKLFRESFFNQEFWWNKLGGHHISVIHFKGKTIMAMDGKSNNYYFNKILTPFLR